MKFLAFLLIIPFGIGSISSLVKLTDKFNIGYLFLFGICITMVYFLLEYLTDGRWKVNG